ncbi:hypothetical protein [Methylobacterium sp.]|uniref:acyltransferase n=1 Tax=Methylobacterium sp. TaxID=409 RepID=UPI00338FE00D
MSGGIASYRLEPTVVEDAVYIGPGAVVSAGSRIGAHSIIGALSFVNGDVPPYSFAAGAPLRQIGRVEIGPDGQVVIRRKP